MIFLQIRNFPKIFIRTTNIYEILNYIYLVSKHENNEHNNFVLLDVIYEGFLNWTLILSEWWNLITVTFVYTNTEKHFRTHIHSREKATLFEFRLLRNISVKSQTTPNTHLHHPFAPTPPPTTQHIKFSPHRKRNTCSKK